MTTQEAREELDKALYNYLEALGYDPDDVDYSAFNAEFDNLAELVP